ncbi:MAG: flagellar hook-basal body complex protein FliE [Candidatus Aureabacteria bacterium]|nr:flagellar hook-basal body complex protein FliE [Candidatus Auribacterota bacterium]
MNEINASRLTHIGLDKISEKLKTGVKKNETDGPGFNEILKGFMTEVNDLQLKAEDKIEKLATGEVKDIHEVMTAVTEADTSFRIMMDIRNKLMNAYKEVMKLGGGM